MLLWLVLGLMLGVKVMDRVNVAERMRCGQILNNHFTANLLASLGLGLSY